MRRSLLRAAVCCAVLATFACGAQGAAAATKPKPKPTVTVTKILQSLFRSAAITAPQYAMYRADWNAAVSEEGSLTGWRKQNLDDVTAQLQYLASHRDMTAARLPVLFLTLTNNTSYWQSGKRLVYADRVEFPGSLLEWEFYPGYGLQLQVLGTFGEANGFSEIPDNAGEPQLVQVLDEMEALAVHRGGGLAWEYYFEWEGGSPPWVSAMSQATGIEALTNGYIESGNAAYLTEAHAALPLLQTAPPTGVEVKTSLGARFLQYSFAPKTDIINAFLQTLIGLYDYETVSNDPVAENLFNIGNVQAESEVRSFVAQGWSLYQPGELDNLNYHTLVTGFTESLCQKLALPVYCNTYVDFETDLLSHPSLSVVTTEAPVNKAFKLSFKLSKAADVGITLSQNGKDYIYTKALFAGGTRSFKAPKLKAGTYSLTMSATDLVGHYVSVSGNFYVCGAVCPTPPVLTSPTTTTPTVTTPKPTTTTTTTPTSTSTTTTTTPTTTPTSPTSPTSPQPSGGTAPIP